MSSGTKRASLKDVAQLAGVSIATASRAISGRGYIDATTRQTTLEAAQTLNYQPNLQARNLRRQSSCLVGLILPNLLNAYFTSLADALSHLLYAKGYHLWLSSTQDDGQAEKGILHDMLGYPVEGLIWVPTLGGDADNLRYIQGRRIPAVTLVRRVTDDQLDTIVFEDEAGSLAAVSHLIQMGHRRIAYVGSDARHSTYAERRRAYIACLEAAGIPPRAEYIKEGAHWATLGQTATLELLRLPEPPSAIFISSSALAPGVLKTLRQYHVRIPEQMSVICFDDLEWFSFSSPPITAVMHDQNKLAHAAVDLLLSRIDQAERAGAPPAFMTIDFDLVLRQSTGKPPAT